MALLRLATVVTALALVAGHGHMTLPASTRNGGSLSTGGSCTDGQCFWFSNNVEIPGPETLPRRFRSVNVNVTGEADVYKTSPWRAPGTAPVYGSGCGAAGGGPELFSNGGYPPKGSVQGADGIKLPAHGTPTVWTKGSEQEVGWAIAANHGGGYQYRICKANGNVSEACFQANPLRFAGETSWIAYPDGTRSAFPMVKVTQGTFPQGSEWARDPVPGCVVCDSFSTCGAPLKPVPGYDGGDWDKQVNCYGHCCGSSASKATGQCPGETQFPVQHAGISGFKGQPWAWSIVDKVVVPHDVEAGAYLLSWRWDCEESTQVWQNCADINIVDAPLITTQTSRFGIPLTK